VRVDSYCVSFFLLFFPLSFLIAPLSPQRRAFRAVAMEGAEAEEGACRLWGSSGTSTPRWVGWLGRLIGRLGRLGWLERLGRLGVAAVLLRRLAEPPLHARIAPLSPPPRPSAGLGAVHLAALRALARRPPRERRRCGARRLRLRLVVLGLGPGLGPGRHGSWRGRRRGRAASGVAAARSRRQHATKQQNAISSSRKTRLRA
jgi:hypothetical protein